jgi:hypothetical protein
MCAASMEAPSYGASKLPFAIRHRPTLYVTKFASCVGSPFVIPGRRCYPRVDSKTVIELHDQSRMSKFGIKTDVASAPADSGPMTDIGRGQFRAKSRLMHGSN